MSPVRFTVNHAPMVPARETATATTARTKSSIAMESSAATQRTSSRSDRSRGDQEHDQRPRAEEQVFDDLLGDDADDGGGNERDGDGDEQPATVVAPPQQTLGHNSDALSVQREHSEDGAELNGDLVALDRVASSAGR